MLLACVGYVCNKSIGPYYVPLFPSDIRGVLDKFKISQDFTNFEQHMYYMALLAVFHFLRLTWLWLLSKIWGEFKTCTDTDTSMGDDQFIGKESATQKLHIHEYLTDSPHHIKSNLMDMILSLACILNINRSAWYANKQVNPLLTPRCIKIRDHGRPAFVDSWI